uniref:Uncharacterized protein n=1 Tax=OCS116 cluster bacterium TaxID=2030921 RepID=A0A2A4YRN6_9PROT
MTYLVYMNDGAFASLTTTERYDDGTISSCCKAFGFVGEIPETFEAFEQEITKDGATYTIGCAELVDEHIGNAEYDEVSREIVDDEGVFKMVITHSDIAPVVPEPVVHKIPTLLVVDRLVKMDKFDEVAAALKANKPNERDFVRFTLANYIYSDNAEVLTLFAALGVDASVVLAPESDGV